MAGLFGTFNTANSGLRVQQNALSTTAHNIANVTTDGYSRQRAVAVTTRPYGGASMFDSCTVGQIGTGAETNVIQRIRDEFNDYQVRTSNSQVNNSKIRYDYLSEIQDILGEISTSGLQGGLSALYTAFQNLSNKADTSGNRTTALTAASDLADLIRRRYGELEDLQEDTQDLISKSVSGINGKLDEIRELNKQIKKITVLGMSPNDLMDKRDALVDELSEQFGVKVEYCEDNTIKLKSADGKTELVSDNYSDYSYNRFSTVEKVSEITGSGNNCSLTFDYAVLGDSNNLKQMTLTGTQTELEMLKKNLETNRILVCDSNGYISQTVTDPTSQTTITQTLPRNDTRVTDSNGIQVTYKNGTIDISNELGTKLIFTGTPPEATMKVDGKTIKITKNSANKVTIETTTPAQAPARPSVNKQEITFDSATGAATIKNNTDAAISYAAPTINSVIAGESVFKPESGKIGGLQDIQKEIENYKSELDKVAISIAYTFNSIQTGTTDSSIDTDYQVLFAAQNSYKQPSDLRVNGTNVEKILPNGGVDPAVTPIPIVDGKFTYDGKNYSVDSDNNIYLLDSNGKKIATDNGINAKNISVNSNMVGIGADNMMLNVGKLKPNSPNGENDGTAALAMAKIADLKVVFTSISDPSSITSRENFFNATNITFNPDEKYYLSGDKDGTTISNYYGTLVSNLGNKVDSSEDNYTNMKIGLNQAITNRNSVSGVSLDEEMTNIMQFQHAYQANAKMINTIDQLLNVVINGLMA